MKRKIQIVFIVACLISFCSCRHDRKIEVIAEPQTITVPSVSAQTEHIQSSSVNTQQYDFDDIYCTASLFYCMDDGMILCDKNIDTKIYPASLTKLLTACTALKYVRPDSEMRVSSELDMVQSGSSICLISNGHILTLHDLLIGLLVASGNDAAYTIAVNTARYLMPNENLSDKEAVLYFTNLMNDFADDIGMKNSSFTTPDGWDDEMQYTTVRDLLYLSIYALSVPTMKEVVNYSEKYVVFESGENITWQNSNKLLIKDNGYYCENAIGMKTGTTSNAGYCLIAAFMKNGKTYISIVTGCKNDNDRYELTMQMFNALT